MGNFLDALPERSTHLQFLTSLLYDLGHPKHFSDSFDGGLNRPLRSCSAPSQAHGAQSKVSHFAQVIVGVDPQAERNGSIAQAVISIPATLRAFPRTSKATFSTWPRTHSARTSTKACGGELLLESARVTGLQEQRQKRRPAFCVVLGGPPVLSQRHCHRFVGHSTRPCNFRRVPSSHWLPVSHSGSLPRTDS